MTSSTKLALFFSLFVGLLIFSAIGLRVFFLVLQSKYDGQHRFTVAISTPQKNTSVKSLTLISVAPETHTLSQLRLHGEKIGDAVYVGKYVGIPVDAIVQFKPDGEESRQLDKEPPHQILKRVLLEYQQVITTLTLIDVVRLYIFARSLPIHAITTQDVAVANTANLKDQAMLDTTAGQLFIDASFASEELSIQVVNGTDTLGLANRLARLLTNMGGNVVVVTSSETVLPRSEILYSGEMSYTVEKLKKTFGFSSRKMQKGDISDIIIRIGKDSQQSAVF